MRRCRVRGKIASIAEEIGWGTWIRTRTNGVRVRWSTVNLFPKVRCRALPVASVWRAYKQNGGQCKYLLAKKCDLDVAAGFLHRFAASKVRGGAAHWRASGSGERAEAEVLSILLSAELAASGLSPWRRSQKQFGEWGLRWYSRANEKSRERLERPKGLRGAMVETSERPRSRRKAVRIRGVGSRPQ